ncbi:MAG: extracellular solute-binding protein [Lachnospiraceae bacterium]|nr:extracellular solute-binding protein [Lachnospiraceae bacterium]
MKKRFTNLLLCFCILVTLSACSKESIDISGKESVNEAQQAEVVSWKATHYSLGCHLEQAVVKDDIVYGCYIDSTGATVVFQEAEGNEILKEVKIEGVTEVRTITVDTNGNIYVLGVTRDKEIFWKIDHNGELSALGDFVLDHVNERHEVVPKGLYVDDAGYFYFWYETILPIREFWEDEPENVYTLVDQIYVKDARLDTLFYEQVPNSNGSQLLSFTVGSDGVPVMLAKDPEGVYVQEVHAEQEGATEKIRMEDVGSLNDMEKVSAIEGGFLFCRGSGVYKYLFKEQAAEKLLELSTYGIYPSDIIYLGMKGDAIEIVDNYDENGNSEYTYLEVGQSEEIILTLGSMEAFAELKDAVTSFNRFSDGIRIEIITYYDEEEGFDAGVEQLKLDIVRGEATDILEVSMIDYEMLAKKNAFVDLYLYMEQDSECCKEQLMPSALRAYELEGHLYNIAPAFQLYSMWGSNSIVQGRYGVTLTELMQILKNNGKNINAINGFSADEPVLTTLCTMGMDEFIDWESGTCSFESEGFKEVLEFAKEYKGGYKNGSLSADIQKGDILMSVGLISSVADYQLQAKLYGDNLDFIGYPAVEGSGTAVSFRGSQLAINAKGENQDKAWEFIKYYLMNGYGNGGFPVIKTQFDTKMEQVMEKTYASTPEGEVPVINRTYKDSNNYIEIYEATQSDVDAVKQLIQRADVKFKYHTHIQNIINEEAEFFFEGQKSLDEVTALIQNRVGVYLQEQMD